MIRFYAYTLIVPVHIVEEKYSGGIQKLIADFSGSKIQQDEYLMAIGLDSPTEVGIALDHLISNGIDFNEELEESRECTVWAKEGAWWDVEWLVMEEEKAWFIADVEAP